MPGDAGDVVVQLRSDPPNDLRLKVPLAVGQDMVFQAMLNPGWPRSLISSAVSQDPIGGSTELIQRRGSGLYVLRDLRMDGQRVPDVEATVSLAATLFQTDIMLGFNFFQRYSSVHLFIESLQGILIAR